MLSMARSQKLRDWNESCLGNKWHRNAELPTPLKSIAAFLAVMNVSTSLIAPKQYSTATFGTECIVQCTKVYDYTFFAELSAETGGEFAYELVGRRLKTV
jgi:hypothetical protein